MVLWHLNRRLSARHEPHMSFQGRFSRILRLVRQVKVMGSTAYAVYKNGSADVTAGANGVYTVTAMSRWSILNKQLPGPFARSWSFAAGYHVGEGIFADRVFFFAEQLLKQSGPSTSMTLTILVRSRGPSTTTRSPVDVVCLQCSRPRCRIQRFGIALRSARCQTPTPL